MRLVPTFSRRTWGLLAVAFLLALVATLPLSAAARMLGLADARISARSLRGPVWWGGAEELQLGRLRIGTVDVLLSPLLLLTGEARLTLYRDKGLPDDIRGALTVGLMRRGFDDVTGLVPAGGAFAPLPVSALSLQNVDIAFAGGRCVGAEGRIRADLAAGLAGLDLANGLSGAPRCDGPDLLLPLVSQSGTERIDMRISGDGRYVATLRVTGADPAGLEAAGFAAAPDGSRVLRVAGRL